MSDRERDKQGNYVETVTPARVLAAIQGADDPVVTTNDVASVLGCSTESARQKLVSLHENGEVERKEVGARAVVWWTP